MDGISYFRPPCKVKNPIIKQNNDQQVGKMFRCKMGAERVLVIRFGRKPIIIQYKWHSSNLNVGVGFQ